MIRLVSFNVHKGVGWHRFKSTLQAIDEHLRRLSPDIIFFQEIKGEQAELIASDIWLHYSYGKNVIYPKGHYGNAIFTKFPILFTENFDLSTSRFDRRGLLHTIIQIYPGQRLHLICVHLGLFHKMRKIQYEKIVAYIEKIIPEDDPIILGGDFNDWGSQASMLLEKELGLIEIFKVLNGAYARTFPAWRPILKLDRIYSRGVVMIQAERLIHSSWCKLSDHIALQAIFDI